MDRARGLPRGAGRDAGQVARRTGACSSSSSTASSSAPPSSPRSREGVREDGGDRAPTAQASSTSRSCAARSRRRCATATRARCATSRVWRSPRSGARAKAPASSASTSSASAARCGLRAEPAARPAGGRPARATASRATQIRRFEALLRRELERAQIERTEQLPPARPLNELDRALPSGPLQDLAAVHRVVAQLKRRLKTQGQEQRGRKRHAARRRAQDDARLAASTAACRSCSSTSRCARGARRSTCSATSRPRSRAPVGLLPLGAARAARLVSQDALVRVHRAHQRGHRGLRARSATSRPSARRSRRDAGVADISGYTDYGRVWSEFRELVEDDLHPRATVIVLGDARTNGRDPRADIFAHDRRQGRAGRSG